MTKQELSYLTNDELKAVAKSVGGKIKGMKRDDAENALLEYVETAFGKKKSESAPKVKIADTIAKIKDFASRIKLDIRMRRKTVDEVEVDFACSIIMPNEKALSIFPKASGKCHMYYQNAVILIGENKNVDLDTAFDHITQLKMLALAENKRCKEDAEAKVADAADAKVKKIAMNDVITKAKIRSKAEAKAADAKVKSEAKAADAKIKSDAKAADAKIKADAKVAEAKAKAETKAAEAKAKAETKAAEAKAKASIKAKSNAKAQSIK